MFFSAQGAVIFRSPFYSICLVNRSSQNSRDIVVAKGKYSVRGSHFTKTFYQEGKDRERNVSGQHKPLHHLT